MNTPPPPPAGNPAFATRRWGLLALALGAACLLVLTVHHLRADAQITSLDATQCEAGGSYMADASAGLISDCKALVAAHNHWAGQPDASAGSDVFTWGGDITTWSGLHFSSQRVTQLWLFEDQLTGSIPTQLGDITNLTRVYLDINQLTGNIPTELGTLTNLERLWLNDNQLTGAIPTQLGSLTNLQHLYLEDNQLTGTIPIELGSLTNLTHLGLDNNNLTGTIPTQLGSLTNLQQLYLNNNQLTGSIPTELGSLASLGTLWLSNNQLTGAIPIELGSLTNLQYLGLNVNKLTGTIPTQLGSLTNLQWLYLNSNQLTGAIPDLTALTSLEILWLSNNRLTGNIPTWLGTLTNLRLLYLNNNQLTGNIPTQLSSLTNLEIMYLNNNQLTGAIPTQLGSLTNLEELYLHRNQLTGAIPAQLGTLTNLELLWLFNNQLSGCVPVSLRGVFSLVFSGNPDLGSFCDGTGNIGNVVLLVTPGDGQAALSWVVEDRGVSGLAYRMCSEEAAASCGNWEELDVASDSVVVEGLDNGVEVWFQLQVSYRDGDTFLTPLVSALPMGLSAGEPADGAVYSACVGAAADPAGFEDIDGSFAEGAINCMAHYGITRGRSATVFNPSATISRWELALFLARAAVPAGVVLSPADQGFADVGGLSDEARLAVNGVAAAGIMPGVNDALFDPNGLVTRGSAAAALDAFLGEAVIGFGGTHPDDATPADAFTDIDQVPVSSYNAIRRLFELGIIRGTTDTTFAPQQLVTRAQMAVLMARLLAHTQARPAGLSLQVVGPEATGRASELLVSYRDPGFQPLPDVWVDVFAIAADDLNEAYDDQGECTDAAKPAVEGFTACRIDFADLSTDDLGDAFADFDSTGDITLVAWTGDIGDTYNTGATEVSASLALTIKDPADRLMVSDSLAETQTKLRYGDQVAYDLQLADSDGNPVALTGVKMSISIVETGTDSSDTITRTHATDNAGKVTFTWTMTDPDPAADDADTSVTITILGINHRVDSQDAVSCQDNQCTATWSDDDPAPEKVVLVQDEEYTLRADGAANRIQVQLTDQYGDPVRGEQITITTGTHDEPIGRYTGSNGMTAFAYQAVDQTPGAETISAEHTAENGRTLSDRITHYWAAHLDQTTADGTVLAVNTGTDEVVIQDGDQVLLIRYDSNDQYNDRNGNPLSFADFEKALEDITTSDLQITDYTGDPDQVSVIALT